MLEDLLIRTASAGPRSGDVLDGKYKLLTQLGDGGMGTVFEAEQLALERSVVVKILHPELVHCGRARGIRNEALAASRVRNPHCVTMFDCGVLPDGVPYLVMEHVPGRSLRRLITEEAVSLRRAVDLMDQILSALGAAHDAGVIHGDVTSANMLVELVDERDHVTVIDFGLARILDSRDAPRLSDRSASVSGTPEYMAPEIVCGAPPTRASDLYGAGAILYDLLTGTTPFGGGPPATVMMQHVHDAVVPPSVRRPERGIPPGLDAAVLRALEKQPEARYPDAASFARAIATAAGVARPSSDAPIARGQDRAAGAAGHPSEGSRPGPSTDGGGGGSAARKQRIRRIRRSIAAAVVSGDLDQIATGHLELADLLGGEQPAAAARVLQRGIELLAAGSGPGKARASADQLVIALAALHARSGAATLARCVATGTDDCKTLLDQAR